VGVKKDPAEAVRWLRKAAEKGNSAAQCTLGYCYDCGLGVPKDVANAAEWYAKSAQAGHEVGMYNLALCYAYGRGVRQDRTLADRWLTKCADAGYGPAKQQQIAVRVEGWAKVLNALDVLGAGSGGGGNDGPNQDDIAAEERRRNRFEGRIYDDQMRRIDPSYIAPIR
jgi:hypothetical protein